MRMRVWMRPLLILGAVTLGAAAGAPARGQAAGVQCAKCHANHDFIAGKGRLGQPDTALFVSDTILHGTAHASLTCGACHKGYDAGYPHQAAQVVVPCRTCHEQAGKDWEASIHAANAATKGDAPSCVSCHGNHRIYGAQDPRSPVYPLNVAATCGRCHGDARIIGRYFTGPDKLQARIATVQFPKSVHGMALTAAGLIVSATCSDCHGAHKILPADSAASSVNRANIPATCGRCHAGIAQVFDSSAHSPAYPRTPGASAAKKDRPVCADCHSPHAIVRADEPRWLLGVVEECGSCHEREYETYFETYHGQVTQLGFGLVAKCSDCHTAHDMRGVTDPKSTVFATNLAATCSRCHAGANASFVKYYAHPDPTNLAKYPRLFWPWAFMTTLLVSVMAFFALHTALWLTRNLINYRRGRRQPHGSEP